MPSNHLKAVILGAIGVLVLVVVALGVVFVTMRQPAKTAGNAVTIEVSDKTCTPDTVSVAAGTPDFSIKNTSDHAMEWEILKGVIVVAERENIAPGFTVELTPRLEPGAYEMTCGLLSNPHGKLTVVAADGSTTALPAPPKPADLVAPTAEYRVYVIQSADQLASATTALATAVKAADLNAARAHVAEAVTALGHIAPVLHLFGQDAAPLSTGPAGLPALEKWLAGATTTDGLQDTVDGTAKSASALAGSVHSTTAAPKEIIAGAGTVMADLAKNPGSPADAAGRVAGVRKVVDLFQPLALRADKALSAKLDSDLSAVEGAIGKASGPPPQAADLAADLTDLLSALGLNAS